MGIVSLVLGVASLVLTVAYVNGVAAGIGAIGAIIGLIAAGRRDICAGGGLLLSLVCMLWSLLQIVTTESADPIGNIFGLL